ncbi:DUF1492 domain-containing protein [Streptococcus panodentis]|uniref:Sigma-70 family RNA polymerase sigma factor n=1 Tax=Streptococcus panodentis TaxID=1581472 RepID=A0ABS5AX23_9STRE|nr:DUF1492 domain-containing protein [Streptococcus panodentis]MBP2621134.1 sigma-70 family RNA polymerase sigma factor [Streptococcus panodentis]
MTIDIRRRLKALKYIDIKAKSKHQEIISLKSGILRSQQYNDMPKAESPVNRSEELNVLIIDKSEKIYREIQQLYKERDELVKAIEALDDPVENLIMRLYYINGHSIKEIERELPLSRRAIFYTKESAEEKISHTLHPPAL